MDHLQSVISPRSTSFLLAQAFFSIHFMKHIFEAKRCHNDVLSVRIVTSSLPFSSPICCWRNLIEFFSLFNALKSRHHDTTRWDRHILVFNLIVNHTELHRVFGIRWQFDLLLHQPKLWKGKLAGSVDWTTFSLSGFLYLFLSLKNN